MSSDHVIIVARNTTTGEVRLALGDSLTLHHRHDVPIVLETQLPHFMNDWSLCVYAPIGGWHPGTKK